MQIHVSEHEGGVRLLRLERPPANAINGEFLAALHAAASQADDDAAVRALVIAGTGKFFSAGLDIKEIATKGIGALADLGGGQDGIYRLWRVGKPTIAMIGGHALAGGAVLMMACDFRIAARGNYKIGLTETALGLALPNGAFQIARHAIPPAHAREVVLGAGSYTPEEALRVGLVDRLVEADELESACLEFAAKMGAHPSAAYGYQKYKLQAETDLAIREPVPAGTERFRDAFLSPELFARIAPGKG